MYCRSYIASHQQLPDAYHDGQKDERVDAAGPCYLDIPSPLDYGPQNVWVDNYGPHFSISERYPSDPANKTIDDEGHKAEPAEVGISVAKDGERRETRF